MNRIIFWIVFFGVVALLVWGMMASSGGKKTPTGTLTVPVSAEDWSKGASSTVTLVEYSDFQCPACAAFYPIAKEVVASTSIRFVYRHFPLITIHKNADYAAAAAEAAGIQGKFWEMHDMLFETQNDWANSADALKTFSTYAQGLGLDVKKFDADVISREVRQKVNDDYRGGSASGVRGTPTFFLNGVMIESPRSAEEFKTLIQNAVASSTQI